MNEKEQPEHLRLSAEVMRSFGYGVVDLLVDHFDRLRDKPVTRKADRATMERLLREPPPRTGAQPLDVLRRLQHDVFDNVMHPDHPRFFAFVPTPSNFASAMADAIVGGFDVFAGTWLESSGPAQIELVTVDWLRELCGLPVTAGGLFVSGGSHANLTALAVARNHRLGDDWHRGVVYYSDQTHSSVERGLRLLGFAPAQLAILTFRYAPPGRTDAELDALNLALVDRLIATGYAMVSSTVLRGRPVLRVCTINPRTTEDDLHGLISLLDRLARA